MFASALAIIWYCADAQAAVDGMAWLDMLCGISSQTEIVDVSNAVEMECRQTEKGLEFLENLYGTLEVVRVAEKESLFVC